MAGEGQRLVAHSVYPVFRLPQPSSFNADMSAYSMMRPEPEEVFRRRRWREGALNHGAEQQLKPWPARRTPRQA